LSRIKKHKIMRAKVSLIAIAFVAAFQFVKAQDNKFNFGLKISPTVAWFKISPTVAWFKASDNLDNDGSKIGFAYGLIADINFTNNYSFETGIDVTYRGGKLKYLDTYKMKTVLQYIELPLTLKLKTNEIGYMTKTNEIGYMTYFGKVGFTTGVNIRTDGDFKKSDINPLNLALVAGIGTQYSLGGKTALLLGITFNNGFLDVVKEKHSKATSNFLAVDLGVMF